MLRLTIHPDQAGRFSTHELTEVNTWRDPAGAVCAVGYVQGDVRWMRFPGLAMFRIDHLGSVDAFPERQIDNTAIVDLYRRTVQPLALQALGWEALHASAVCTPAGLIGFCGERETGKSTIAYALSSRQGCRQFADDAIVLEVDCGEVRALSLPFDPRLRPEASSFFFPRHSSTPSTWSTPSAVSTLSTSRPLDVLFVLKRIASGKPSTERLTSSAAFTAVLSHAHAFDPEQAESRRRTFAHYLEIANAVPIYVLRFAAGLHELDAVLDCVEETAESALFAPAT
jgi:hypothetical protein